MAVIRGKAIFQNSKETYSFFSVWVIENAQARLTYIDFEGGGKEFFLPVKPKGVPKYDLDNFINKPT